MPRPRSASSRPRVTVGRMFLEGFAQHLRRPLKKIPGIARKNAGKFEVWEYLDMPMSDLVGEEFAFTPEEVEQNDAVIAGIHPCLVRGIELTLEAKVALGIDPDPGFDPIENPIIWDIVPLAIPRLHPTTRGIRTRKNEEPMDRDEMYAVIERFRETLKMQIHDSCTHLFRLVDRAPRRAERIVRELKRLGY